MYLQVCVYSATGNSISVDFEKILFMGMLLVNGIPVLAINCAMCNALITSNVLQSK